ncbi:GNAT family N-acetyltransferase [Christensenellaceae bacterium OttesenSCG-928-L17]|nr:GNAT family N-acetyltransferase [Christensenellaceae bacterium OttesenSCG-928-L17]
MVIVKEISEKKDIKKFIQFPNDLYRGHACYVPDMLDSQVADFDRTKNPAYEYCDTKCFLAYRDGKPVGRIAAIYNTMANEKYNDNQMRFWHADYIDDAEVVDALFAAVETWAREKGCTSVHGPLGFSDMDREGLLVEGFDKLGMFLTYYNHPYYQTQMERMGYEKEIDWLEFRLELGEKGDERLQKLERMAEAVARRQKLHIAPLKNKRAVRPYVKGVFDLYNQVYIQLFGTVALTPTQVDRYVDEFLPLIDERTTAIICNEENQVVAFGVAAPTISHAMQKCGGRLFPFGWAHVLHALKGKNNDTLDLFLIAVHPDLQGKGVTTIIMNKIVQFARENGIRYAETGPELETNTDVHAQWRYFDCEQHMRRRCFIKKLT